MLSLSFVLIVIPAAIWLGSIVFQSSVVAATVFTTLAVDDAGRVLRALFPRFFVLGLVCGGVMLIGLALLVAVAGPGHLLQQLLVLTVLMLVCQSLALTLVPKINAARDAGSAAQGRFAKLHGASVALTIAVMLMAIALLVLIAQRGAAGLALT